MSNRSRRFRTACAWTWLGRVVYRLWPMRSPLCRRSDRIEAAVLRTAVLGLAAAIGVGIVLGADTAARAEHTARLARAHTHPYDVVLLHDAPPARPVSGQTSEVGAQVPAPVRWHTPAGSRTGTVKVDADTPAGTHVTVWFDARWHQAPRPETRLGTVLDGIGPGLSVPLGAAAAGALAVLVTRLTLNRRRLRDWDDQWQRVEPAWSHRPRRNHRT